MARNKSVKTSSSASGTTSKPREERVFFEPSGSSTPKQTFLLKEIEREKRRKKVSVEEGKERKKKRKDKEEFVSDRGR